ncbi:hypothetical protein B0H16DRAFT_1518101 [Mycena metata]|uniref:Uncharacterized protein n=1 Tax=Mycena metata TaxID=1033252 RepID=A0AAD7NPZ2_9AGAR|nr:hypothetical protein B0H16DRAFT_1518101 [Mycena metata]
MRFTASLALLVTSAGLVRALDNFLLYNLPPQVNLTQFTTAFDSVCTTLAAEPPTHNVDPPNCTFPKSEPKLYLTVTQTWIGGTTEFQYAAGIAGELGATPFS